MLGFEEGKPEVVGGDALEIDNSRMYKGASDQRTNQEPQGTSFLPRALESSQGQQDNEPTATRAKT